MLRSLAVLILFVSYSFSSDDQIEYEGLFYKGKTIDHVTEVCSIQWSRLDTSIAYPIIFKDCVDRQLKGIKMWELWLERDDLKGSDMDKIETICVRRNLINYEDHIYDEAEPLFDFHSIYKCLVKQHSAALAIYRLREHGLYSSLQSSTGINTDDFFECSEKWAGDFVLWSRCETDFITWMNQEYGNDD